LAAVRECDDESIGRSKNVDWGSVDLPRFPTHVRENAEARKPARKQTGNPVCHSDVDLRQPSLAEAHQEDSCGSDGDNYNDGSHHQSSSSEVDYQGMRKRLIKTTSQVAPHPDEGWLDLDIAAIVEVTSEAKEYPVESALVSGEGWGWRANDSGTQTIRLIFDQPQKLKRIAVVFEETETERTQEFVLRWSSDGGRSFREIVRQQWNFSPPNTTREIEEYNVQLSDVTVLELLIVPDISRGEVRASLKSLRVS
jgi:hypothetical protein